MNLRPGTKKISTINLGLKAIIWHDTYILYNQSMTQDNHLATYYIFFCLLIFLLMGFYLYIVK